MGLDILSYLLGSQISSSGSGDLSDATATRADILYPKTAYLSNGRKNTGTMQSLSAATFTPSTANQVIASGKYLAGDQTILGDPNLIADNIRKSITIFGVTGTYTNAPDSTKTVRFIDYDGSILYSFTANEFAGLSSLPSNPTHTGLTSQGWNWSLSDAKTYVAARGALDIGQMYTPTSGNTEIDITLASPNLSPYLILTISSPVTIDWGDNSATEQIAQTGQRAIQHIYAAPGDYTISIAGSDNSFSFSDNFYAANAGVLSASNSLTKSTLYSSTIKAIRLSSNATIGVGAFNSCTQLEYITIPTGATMIEQIAFYHCLKLKAIIIPNTVTKLGLGSFSGCISLEKVSIPNSLVTIEGESFNSCRKLQNIALPTSVTTINQQAFANCSSLEKAALPSSIVTLEDRIFSNCAMLSSAEITHSDTAIPSYTFASCWNLVEVSLPSTIQYIRENAFNGCSSLQSISIPVSTTAIYSNAFSGCSSLSSIHFLPTTPPTVSHSNAFTGLPSNCIIYVPFGTLQTYASATNYPSPSIYTYMEE